MRSITTNSIMIGRVIFELLSQNLELRKLVGNKVFPVVIQEDIEFPYVVYRRSRLIPSYTKDNYATDDTVYVDVIAVAEDYMSSLNLAQAIRCALEGKKGQYDDIDIINIELEDSQEDGEDVFVQGLTFKINCR